MKGKVFLGLLVAVLVLTACGAPRPAAPAPVAPAPAPPLPQPGPLNLEESYLEFLVQLLTEAENTFADFEKQVDSYGKWELDGKSLAAEATATKEKIEAAKEKLETKTPPVRCERVHSLALVYLQQLSSAAGLTGESAEKLLPPGRLSHIAVAFAEVVAAQKTKEKISEELEKFE